MSSNVHKIAHKQRNYILGWVYNCLIQICNNGYNLNGSKLKKGDVMYFVQLGYPYRDDVMFSEEFS